MDYSGDALTAIANKCVKSSNSLGRRSVQKLFNGEGIDASILRIGSQGWKKGKIKFKITLEFCPDEPEVEEITQISGSENNINSPLDDIRRMMDK